MPERQRHFVRRRRTLLTVLGSLVTAAILVAPLAGRRDEFSEALSSAPLWLLGVTALLQIVAWAGADQLGASLRRRPTRTDRSSNIGLAEARPGD